MLYVCFAVASLLILVLEPLFLFLDTPFLVLETFLLKETGFLLLSALLLCLAKYFPGFLSVLPMIPRISYTV